MVFIGEPVKFFDRSLRYFEHLAKEAWKNFQEEDTSCEQLGFGFACSEKKAFG